MSEITNSPLQTFQFDGIPIQVIDQNGEGWMTGEDIGIALEYADDPKNSVRKIFERNRDELEEYSVTVKLTATDGKQYDTRVYNEEGVMIIGFLSKQPKAVMFRKWAVKILKAYRHKPIADETAYQTLQQKYIALLEREVERLHATGPETVRPVTREDSNVTDTIIQMEFDGCPRYEIVAATGRSFNCIRQVIYRARRDGLLPPAYQGGAQ